MPKANNKDVNVQVIHGGCQCILLILGDFSWSWMVLGNFGLFYDLYFLHDLKLTTMAFENDGYLKLNALPLSLTIYNILNKRGKWQNLNQEKISVRRKIIFKKISLLFFGANVNVLRRTSLQVLRNTSTNIKK